MAIVLDIERLLECHEINSRGFLIGLIPSRKDSKVVVVGFCSSFSSRDDDQSFDWQEGREFVRRHYPAGSDIIGCYYGLNEWAEEDQTKSLTKLIINSGLDQAIVLLTISPDRQVSAYNVSKGGHQLESSSITNSRTLSDYIDRCPSFHLQTQFTIHLSPKVTATVVLDRLQEVLNGCVLWLPEQRIILDVHSKELECNLKSSSKSDKLPVTVELLRKSPSLLPNVHPLTVTITPLATPTITLPITLNVVGVFRSDVMLCDVARQLRTRMEYQIQQIANHITGRGEYCTVSLHHFLLPNNHVPVTISYPHLSVSDGDAPITDTNLLPLREKLHKRFCLPLTQPFLRKLNRQWLPWKQEQRLVNPHIALKLIPDSRGVAMVTGSYAYYHYMQDKFNDNGWGCAYRSLQTLWSWFRFQGYTVINVPSHHEIQQTLVDCGDKPVSFINSLQWIGSIEVSTVLNHLLQIDSRIHHCPSGADLAGTGRILQHHFRTQGTPIMIGGGVLAHTILGVDYNEQSGDIKFLILDPHYIGKEDLKLIQGQGCGWKSVNFFDQTASYNMCMPLKPQEI